jgi:hypothetical protein
MAIERDINKKKKEREPAQKATPMKPFKGFGKGLKSPSYKKRNPHKDSGDKKPSLKTKASIIKDKAKKGQGLAKGGAVKSIISRLLPKFTPTPKSGTISTINQAKKFVDIRSRVKKAGGYAMGGEASESVARSKIIKEMRDRKRKRLMDSLDRLNPRTIKPKKKPKRDKTKIGDTIKPKLGIK